MSVLGLRVSYEIGGRPAKDGMRVIRSAFERAGAELARVGRHVFPRVIPVLEKDIREQFAAEGRGPVAGKWAPLSVRYAARKAVRWPGQPINVASGTMRRALTDGAAGNALRAYSDSSLAFGTMGVSYASFAQSGTRRMPSRPPLDFDRGTEYRIRKATEAGVRDAIVRAGIDALADVKESV